MIPREQIAARVAASRRAQGLPVKVSEPAALRKIAALVSTGGAR